MATKTINLIGTEVAVTGLDGAHAHIRNDSTDTIYASKMPGITAGADGVASIPAGQADTLRGISGAVYLLGTGSVLIQSDDYVTSPFKASTASGGSAVDTASRAASLIDFNDPNVLIKAGYSGSSLATATHIAAYDTSGLDSGDAVRIKDMPISTLAELLTSTIHNRFVINLNNEINVSEVLNNFSYPNNYECNSDSESSSAIGLTENWWYIKYFHHIYGSGYGFQLAFPLNKPLEQPRYRTSTGNGWDEWKLLSDGGNAASLESHPASDFVLKSDYDALAARVAALEAG